jgi:hypothetical protein
MDPTLLHVSRFARENNRPPRRRPEKTHWRARCGADAKRCPQRYSRRSSRVIRAFGGRRMSPSLRTSFELVARRAKAKFVAGLSATITREDGHHPIIFMQCGPVRYRVDARKQAAERPFTHHVFVRPTGFRAPAPSEPDPLSMWVGCIVCTTANPKHVSMIMRIWMLRCWQGCSTDDVADMRRSVIRFASAERIAWMARRRSVAD